MPYITNGIVPGSEQDEASQNKPSGENTIDEY